MILPYKLTIHPHMWDQTSNIDLQSLWFNRKIIQQDQVAQDPTRMKGGGSTLIYTLTGDKSKAFAHGERRGCAWAKWGCAWDKCGKCGVEVRWSGVELEWKWSEWVRSLSGSGVSGVEVWVPLLGLTPSSLNAPTSSRRGRAAHRNLHPCQLTQGTCLRH